MAKVNDIPTFLKGRKVADAPALVVNEDEIRKINTSQKALQQNCPRNNQKRNWEICTTSWNQSNSRGIH